MKEIRLCKDCEHAVINSTGGVMRVEDYPYAAVCIASQRVNLVNGTFTPMNFCFGERVDGACGVEGKNFKEKAR